jgi:hypothetical protein
MRLLNPTVTHLYQCGAAPQHELAPAMTSQSRTVPLPRCALCLSLNPAPAHGGGRS